MKQRIKELFTNVNKNMLNDVSISFEEGIQACIYNNGGNFENIL